MVLVEDRADGQIAPPIKLALPAKAAGRWCRVRVRAGKAAWWARITLVDPTRGQVVRSLFLGPLHHGGRSTLVHIPLSADSIAIQLYGIFWATPEVGVRVLGRATLAGRLLLGGWRLLPRAAFGDLLGVVGRTRALLGQAPARAGEAPPYRSWIEYLERGESSPPTMTEAGAITWQVVLLGTPGAALDATLDSIRAQWEPPVQPIIGWPDDRLGQAPAESWAVVVQAGEVLAPDALVRFAAQAEATPDAAFIYADYDELDALGALSAPFFKPGPDRRLLSTGLLSRGACAIRCGDLFACAAFDRAAAADADRHADAVRLAAALALRDRIARVARVLTHRRFDTASVQPRALAALAQADLQARNFSGTAAPADARAAVRLTLPGGETPSVSVIVPSACRSGHVVRCLRRMVGATAYAPIEFIVAVSEIRPGDRVQASVLAQLSRLPNLRVVAFDAQPFNYAAVNNRAACHATGDLLLLLNDDVVPVDPGWLATMVAELQDPEVGVVGARLLYGNGMVQHAGVIMGLAELCEHADRLLDGADPGAHDFGRITREVAAVTAACMLVRAGVYRDLGGMDERFAIALNDVDFCLRARAAGHRVVHAADAVLTHYESLSLGRHYSGARAELEAVEVQRLRNKWAPVIADDPFYNPQASRQPGREWQPGFNAA